MQIVLWYLRRIHYIYIFRMRWFALLTDFSNCYFTASESEAHIKEFHLHLNKSSAYKTVYSVQVNLVYTQFIYYFKKENYQIYISQISKLKKIIVIYTF